LGSRAKVDPRPLSHQPTTFSELKAAQNGRTQSSSLVGSGNHSPGHPSLMAHSFREHVSVHALSKPQPRPKTISTWRIKSGLGAVVLGAGLEAGSSAPVEQQAGLLAASLLPPAIDTAGNGGDRELLKGCRFWELCRRPHLGCERDWPMEVVVPSVNSIVERVDLCSGMTNGVGVLKALGWAHDNRDAERLPFFGIH
jgi:hypothetical protein